MTVTNKSRISAFFLLLAIQEMTFARSITPSQVSGTVFLFPGNDSTSEITAAIGAVMWSHHIITFTITHCHSLTPICLLHWPH